MLGALTAASSILGGITTTIGGFQKRAQGKRRMRAAQDALANYQRQELQDAFGEVGVSRLGADLMRMENARMAGTSVDALRSGGMRGLGQLGQIQRGTNMLNQGLASNLDQQQQGINMARAQDSATIRAMQEQREQQDIAGLGREIDAGRQDYYGGMQDVGQGLLSVGAIGASAMTGGAGAGTGLGGMFGGGGGPGIGNILSNTKVQSPINRGIAQMGQLSGNNNPFAVTNPLFQ